MWKEVFVQSLPFVALAKSYGLRQRIRPKRSTTDLPDSPYIVTYFRQYRQTIPSLFTSFTPTNINSNILLPRPPARPALPFNSSHHRSIHRTGRPSQLNSQASPWSHGHHGISHQFGLRRIQQCSLQEGRCNVKQLNCINLTSHSIVF